MIRLLYSMGFIGMILTTCQLYGQQEDSLSPNLSYLEKGNPEELYVIYGQHGDCGSSYERVVDNTLIMSRLKRKDVPAIFDTELYLTVNLNCMQTEDGRHQIYTINVIFAKTIYDYNPFEASTIPTPSEPDSLDRSVDEVTRRLAKNIYDALSGTAVYFDPFSYSRLGIVGTDDAGRQFIENGLRSSLENALSDYLKVNFDL